MTPEVSILVSTFNHEKYIQECIESILQQHYFSHNKNFEILVYDDGSSDRTTAIVQSLQNDKIRILRHEQRGVSHGVNVMIEQARSEYLIFISGDDKCLPHRIGAQLDCLKSKPKTLTFSKPLLISPNSEPVANNEFPVFFRFMNQTQNPSATQNRTDFFRRFYFEGNFICAPSFGIRKSDATAIGPFSSLSLQLQDFDYWVRAIKKGYNIYVSETPWMQYRVNLNGAQLSSTKNNSRLLFEHAMIYRDFFNFVDAEFLLKCFANDLHPDHTQSLQHQVACFEILLTQHKEPSVRQTGLEKIYMKFDQPEWKSIYLSLGMKETLFFKMANELSSAPAPTKALNRLVYKLRNIFGS